MKITLLLFSLWFCSACLTACGQTEPTLPLALGSEAAGDVNRGEAIFRQTLIGTQNGPGCITCHALVQGTVLVGPSLAGIGGRASMIITQTHYRGQADNAATYLRESIIQPNVYVVEGFQPDLMRATYAAELSTQEIEDLVAFLLTLK